MIYNGDDEKSTGRDQLRNFGYWSFGYRCFGRFDVVDEALELCLAAT